MSTLAGPGEVVAERVTLVRGFEVALEDAWDGRTLDVRVVPYNQPATVADPPDYQPYQEMFLRGAFERQLATPGRDRVWLNVEHEQGFSGKIGHSLRFHDREDGLHGSFGVLEGGDGDKALQLVGSGFLSGLSLEFRALSSRRVDGIMQRVRAHLDKVSLCRYPAYASAEVLALRDEPDDEPAPAPLEQAGAGWSSVRSSDVDARLAAHGWEPLDDTPDANALAAAAAALEAARAPLAERAATARKLIRYYNRAGLDVPGRLRQIARSA